MRAEERQGTTIRVSLTVTSGEQRGWVGLVLPWLVSLSAVSGVLGLSLPSDPGCGGGSHEASEALVACVAEPAVAGSA